MVGTLWSILRGQRFEVGWIVLKRITKSNGLAQQKPLQELIMVKQREKGRWKKVFQVFSLKFM